MTIEFQRFRFPVPFDSPTRKVLEPIASLTSRRETLPKGEHAIKFDGLPTYHVDVKPRGTGVIISGRDKQALLDQISEVLEVRNNGCVRSYALDRDMPRMVIGSKKDGKPDKILGAVVYKSR